MWLGNSVVVIGNLSCTLENMPEALYYTKLGKKTQETLSSWSIFKIKTFEVPYSYKLLKA